MDLKNKDETECDTHCDGTWNCLNVKDEIGCD